MTRREQQNHHASHEAETGGAQRDGHQVRDAARRHVSEGGDGQAGGQYDTGKLV